MESSSGSPAHSVLSIASWALTSLGVVAFLVAGDVRTNWVVGDIAPEGGEVALPRLGVLALMVGFALLAWHQVRVRRSLPEDRYRGPSILVLLGLTVGLSVFVVLPVRGSVNLLFEGGIPDGRGNLEVATDLMQQAVEFHERRLGRAHPTTAIDLSNLATIEAAAGEMSRAEGLLREALKIHEGMVGGDSQAVATDLANLAAVLQQVGRRDEAQAMLQRAREIAGALFGPEHPRALWLDERLLDLRESRSE